MAQAQFLRPRVSRGLVLPPAAGHGLRQGFLSLGSLDSSSCGFLLEFEYMPWNESFKGRVFPFFLLNKEVRNSIFDLANRQSQQNGAVLKTSLDFTPMLGNQSQFYYFLFGTAIYFLKCAMGVCI